MSLGTIVVDLLARTGSFETDTKRAAKLAQQRAKEIDEAFEKAGKAVGLALAGIATAAAIAFKSTIDRMDELSKAAARASMPTEDFSRLAYAADLADVSMQDLQGSMGKLAKAQGDAAQGAAEQERAFKALGIAYKNADGSLRGTKDVFFDFADKFRKFQGSPEIVTLGMTIFGRSFQTLIPLLKDGAQGLKDAGAEADAFGVTVSTRAGLQAEAFNDSITRLTKAIEGLKIELVQGLLPGLLDVTQRFLDAREAGLGFIDAFDIAANIKGFMTLDEKIADVQRRIADVKSGKWTGLFSTDGLADLEARLAKLTKLRDQFSDRAINADMTALGGSTPAPRAKPLSLLGGSKAKRDMTPIDMTDEQRTLIAAIGLYTDIEKRSKDYGLTLQWLDQLYFDGAIKVEQYDVAVQQLTHSTESFGKDGVAAIEAFHASVLAAKKPLDELGEFTLQTARNIQTHLGDETYNVLSGRFDDIGQRWLDLLNRMMADALAVNLSRVLFGDFDKSGSLGGLFGQGLSLLLGGGAGGGTGGGGPGLGSGLSPGMTSADDWMLAGLAGRRAGGGDVWPGGTFLVGERGPELFRPVTSGTIVPNEKLASPGEAPPIIINIATPDVESFRRSEGQIAARLSSIASRGARFR
ncbi:MAG: hypothetical protein BGO72_21415 [Burkholderiales bacterium 70-64]|nr:MAG: hypothetical protein BGO72_21415 [Burkholderiales bacterium 70-64]